MPKKVDTEQHKADIKIVHKIIETQGKKLRIYSARDQNLKSEERLYAYESNKTYKNVTANFYSLHSKIKL